MFPPPPPCFLNENFKFIFSQTSPCFTCLQYKSIENTVGKGEIARNKQYHFGELSAIYIKFKIVICKTFQFGRIKTC